MFTPVSMKKADIFFSGRQAESVVQSLSRFEGFHVVKDEEARYAGGGEASSPWQERAAASGKVVRRAEKLLASFDSEWPHDSGTGRSLPKGGIDDWQARLSEAEEAQRSWARRTRRFERQRDALWEMKRQAALLTPLKVPLDRLHRSEHIHWVVGTMEAQELDSLRLALFENAAPKITAGDRGQRRLNVFLPAQKVEAAAAVLSDNPDVSIEDAGCGRMDEGGDWRSLSADYSRLADRIEKLAARLDIDTTGRAAERSEKPDSYRREIREIEALLETIEDRANRLANQREENRKDIDRLERQRRRRSALKALDVPVERLPGSGHVHWEAWLLPKTEIGKLELSLFRMPAVCLTGAVDGDRVLVLAATTPDCGDLLRRALDGVFGEPLALPDAAEGRPRHEIAKLDDRLGEYEKRREALKKEHAALVGRCREEILSMHRRAVRGRRIAGIVGRFGCRGGVFFASMTVPDSVVEPLVQALKGATEARAEVEVLAVFEDRTHPLEVMLFRIPLVILPFSAGSGRLLVVAGTSKDCGEVLDAAVRGVFLEPTPLPENFRGLPGEILESVEARLTAAEENLAALMRERVDLSRRWSPLIAAVRDAALARKEIAQAVSALPNREDVFLVSGWVPEPDADRFVAALKSAASGKIDVVLAAPPDAAGRRPPTLLHNPRIFKPFEVIVNTFGAPGYEEIDPTPLTALTFTIMYGIMFGDMGHGLLLAAAGFVVSRRTEGTLRAVGGVLTVSGLAAVVFGYLYGSLFGVEHLLEASWLRPMEGIVPLLEGTVAGGVVLLSLGFFVSIVNQIRIRNWGELLFGHDGVAGLAFYWALVGGGTAAAFRRISPGLMLGLMAVPAALLLLEAPLTRLIGGKRPLLESGLPVFFAEGVTGLFEILIRNVSNSLSFVRLGAFAVAHAGFMKVIFMLADPLGVPWRWGLLAAGTVLIVVFEGLVVGIQALRLQYYEFFGRFFSGKGAPFSPFRLSPAATAREGEGG